MSLVIFAFPLQQQRELWHFRGGVESQGFCLPLKPNTQKHFPAVGEVAAPSLHRFLAESEREGEEGRRTALLALPWLGKSIPGPSPSPAQRALLPKGHLVQETSGEETLNLHSDQSCKKTRQVENPVPSPALQARSARPSPFHANHSPARLYFRWLPRII